MTETFVQGHVYRTRTSSKASTVSQMNFGYEFQSIYIAEYIYTSNLMFPRVLPRWIRRRVADKVGNELRVVVDIAHGASLASRKIGALICRRQCRQLITLTNHHHRLKTQQHMSNNMTGS